MNSTRITSRSTPVDSAIHDLSSTIAPGIRIEPMLPDKAGTVATLFESIVLALPYYNDRAKRAEIAKYSTQLLIESVLKEPESVLVATLDNALAGYCISRDDDGLVWLSWFGVDPSFRQLGVGTALLKALEMSVRQGRSHKIWCDCRTENTQSASVLHRQGYLPLCTVSRHWYEQDFILWEKLIC